LDGTAIVPTASGTSLDDPAIPTISSIERPGGTVDFETPGIIRSAPPIRIGMTSEFVARMGRIGRFHNVYTVRGRGEMPVYSSKAQGCAPVGMRVVDPFPYENQRGSPSGDKYTTFDIVMKMDAISKYDLNLVS
jgi:hypothetical protein